MNTRVTVGASMLLIAMLFASTAMAVDARPRVLSAAAKIYVGGVRDGAKFVTDTVQIYGGPLSNEGRFQDAGNPALPDLQGWFGVDFSTSADTLWNVSDYNCAVLDPTDPDNHAWWCGDTYVSCVGGDDAEGYGNYWHELLQWRMAPQFTDRAVTVNVTARMNVDVEPAEDYFHLLYARINGGVPEFNSVWTHTGTLTDYDFDLTFEVPQDWLDDGQVWLMWRMTSDGAWSDEDCLWPTNGAAQVDLINVTFNQGYGPQQMGVTEDCENPATLQWSPYIMPGAGNYAQVWPLLDDLDAEHQNNTPQVAFVDDGLIVPGTGGSTNTTWTYGPGGFVTNDTGGLTSGSVDLETYMVSPPIAWTSSYRGTQLDVDVYEHLPLGSGMFWRWKVRYTQDPTGDEGWTGWKNSGLHRNDLPEYARRQSDLTHLIPEVPTFVQIALGVEDLGPYWHLTDDVTPAPYFDNVSLKAYRISGPQISALELELPQDDFPTAGAIDPIDLAANSVRFDMGDHADGNFMSLRDSVIISTTAIRTGAVLARLPRMYYSLHANPLFDTVRSSGLPLTGYVEADTARYAGIAYENKWAFDLPDTGFLFPGDVLHVYFTATDDVDGDVRTASLPADLTGFDVLPDDPDYDPLLWPEAFTVRALPVVTSLDPLQHAGILLWDDSEKKVTRQRWVDGLQAAFPDNPQAWDIFVSNGATERLGNGLGGLATAELLSGYQTIIYAGGTELGATLYAADPGHDAQMLLDWIDYDATPRGLMISGCYVLSDLSAFGVAEAELLNRLGVDQYSNDLDPLIDDQHQPEVQADAASAFQGMHWIVDGGPNQYYTTDVVTSTAGSLRLAQFLDPFGASGAYAWAALTLAETGGNRLMAMPYDIILVENAPGHVGRDAYLQFILRVMETAGFQSSFSGSPQSLASLQATAHPNPFNPCTEISWYAPHSGNLSVEIFNLRGEKVRTLVDGSVPAGKGFVNWDGTRRDGSALASGVYFCQIRMEGEQEILKMTLVK
jgi:FlgD Ig-like domain